MELRAENLACARGGVSILEGIDFTLPSGAALILRGPNGSGKTTLLRTLAGLQPAIAGEISAPPDSMAYAAHSDGIKSTLTVAENLGFWAAVFDTDRVAHALEAFDLTELSTRPAGTLSAGQKRRLGLARLAVTGRPIWLLDEPTVSLDARSVALFAAAIRAHLAGGGAALLATHIDLGIEAATLDIARFRAVGTRGPDKSGSAGREPATRPDPFDEAFA